MNYNNAFSDFQIGEFFPKKKIFQQYWIFPFLGLVILFSSNSFFFPFPTKVREKILDSKKKNELMDIRVAKKMNYSTNFLNLVNNERQFSNQFQQDFRMKNFSFFYSDKSAKSQIFDFLEFEKAEFQNFSYFYFKLFQNSVLLSSKNENENKILKNSFFHFSLKNIMKTIPVRKKIEFKRNCFKW